MDSDPNYLEGIYRAAIQVAAHIPSASLGTVEVRPCRDLEVDGVPRKASRKSK